MYTLEKTCLPEKLQERGLDILAFPAHELPDCFVAQLMMKVRQPHVRKYESNEDIGTEEKPGRLRSLRAYRSWAEGKERMLYLVVNQALHPDGLDVPDIGNMQWFSGREHVLAPGRNCTWGIRSFAADPKHGFGQYVGQGLGLPMMQPVFEDAGQYYEGEKAWLDLTDGNTAAERLYTNFGFDKIATFPDPEHGMQVRTVMVHDTIFMRQRPAAT